MSSLLKQGWAGKINLIYIDPPFFTGADLSKYAIQVTRKRLLDIHNSKDLMAEEK